MAVLDTFYILFKSDTKEAEKGFDRINLKLNTVDRSLNRLARRWLSFYGIITAVSRSIQYAFDLSLAAQSLDVAVGALDVWGNAVEKTGGTVDGFTKSIETMSEKLNTTPKVALELLPKLADQFSRLNKVQAQKYGKILGLDTPTILLLQQGRREVDALLARQKELGFVTDRDAVAFKRFRSELQDTRHGFRSLIEQISVATFPYISKFLHFIQDITISLRKHTGFIKGALIPIGAVFVGIAGSIALANLPLTIFIGSVLFLAAAFGLLYDDFQVFMRGGDSLIGRMLERWPALGDAARTTVKAIQLAFEGIMWFFNDLAIGIEKVINSFRALYAWLEPIASRFSSFFSNDVKDVNIITSREAIGVAARTPLGLQNSNIINNRSTNREINLSIGEIKIQTAATDSSEVAYGLTNELQRQLRQTQNDLSTGVLI